MEPRSARGSSASGEARGYARRLVEHHRTPTLLLSLGALLLLLATSPGIGVVWDEPIYMLAAESYAGWLGEFATSPRTALAQPSLDRHWAVNVEHPPLDRVASGLVWAAARRFVDPLTAHRLASLLLAAALVGLLYRFVGGAFGRIAGLAAAAALLTLPRFFFHAHVAALDVPAAASIFAVVALFWWARTRSGLHVGVLLGLAWGAALATKISAVVVPPLLLAWVLLCDRRREQLVRLAVMTVCGALAFVPLWPWLWSSTLERLRWYVGFVTTEHWLIGQWYLGQLWPRAPWHFALVMLVAVVPLGSTLLTLAGLARVLRRDAPGEPGRLLALGLVVPLLPFVLGVSAIYDNDRLLLPAFPFLAALAGVGFDLLWRTIRDALPRPAWAARVAGTAAAAIAFLPPLVVAASLYPFLLSYYSAAVGGPRGAERLGLETTYWCETYGAALSHLNEHAEPGALIWVQDQSHDVLVQYQRLGRLRDDLRIAVRPGAASVFEAQGAQVVPAEIDDADWVLLQRRQTGFTPAVQRFVAAHEPRLRVVRGGVPLMELYRGGAGR